jgi:hypothetical protein
LVIRFQVLTRLVPANPRPSEDSLALNNLSPVLGIRRVYSMWFPVYIHPETLELEMATTSLHRTHNLNQL